jgi:rhamnosyltransferase
MVNRLCIYVVYDKDGIVDDYIPYFLNALAPFVNQFVIVCNGKLNDEGREKLSRFTRDLFVRPNEGYDSGAVKDVLFNLYGWEKVLQFEELLICNDTFYGPLYPLSECFNKMDKSDVDFWGWAGSDADTVYHIYHPVHLQSYFLNIRKTLLSS